MVGCINIPMKVYIKVTTMNNLHLYGPIINGFPALKKTHSRPSFRLNESKKKHLYEAETLKAQNTHPI